jgi:hypothetical protein
MLPRLLPRIAQELGLDEEDLWVLVSEEQSRYHYTGLDHRRWAEEYRVEAQIRDGRRTERLAKRWGTAISATNQRVQSLFRMGYLNEEDRVPKKQELCKAGHPFRPGTRICECHVESSRRLTARRRAARRVKNRL